MARMTPVPDDDLDAITLDGATERAVDATRRFMADPKNVAMRDQWLAEFDRWLSRYGLSWRDPDTARALLAVADLAARASGGNLGRVRPSMVLGLAADAGAEGVRRTTNDDEER